MVNKSIPSIFTCIFSLNIGIKNTLVYIILSKFKRMEEKQKLDEISEIMINSLNLYQL